MKKIVIFASGSGSNAEKIILHFKNSTLGNVVAVFTNNLHAKVLERAKKLDIATQIFTREALNNGEVLEKIEVIQPDLIVLAGFLWKFPENIVKEFPNQIVNIHPALLPKYGGKGMYGMHVHQAVLDNKETQTGITIHFVNEHYDEGGIIFQQTVTIDDCKSAECIAEKVHALEHEYFPLEIEKLLTSNL
ncbi:phosphoribosylglycinamide formyltransferase [Flavobacterium amnicola]|uniref:Phosphoribosylglycinamide formyltransferase n=1 Tax=Flavobacterium amnicola TaxID=2506422 RepID=A0A4Q1K5M9_9FLAO|nr:phosphoribosylglycinamide formyltransferase [Flavobacterium amnicola]RXR20810.1 phosphoribosylglycinamide formyltransferase [Flavobacterium amnicola]